MGVQEPERLLALSMVRRGEPEGERSGNGHSEQIVPMPSTGGTNLGFPSVLIPRAFPVLRPCRKRLPRPVIMPSHHRAPRLDLPGRHKSPTPRRLPDINLLRRSRLVRAALRSCRSSFFLLSPRPLRQCPTSATLPWYGPRSSAFRIIDGRNHVFVCGAFAAFL